MKNRQVELIACLMRQLLVATDALDIAGQRFEATDTPGGPTMLKMATDSQKVLEICFEEAMSIFGPSPRLLMAPHSAHLGLPNERP